MKKTVLLWAIVLVSIFKIHAQTADEIIDKYAKALGGREKLATIKNMYVEGTMNANGHPISIKFWFVNGKCMRTEFEYNGMKGYTILRNDSGWNYNSYSGQKAAEPMTTAMVKSQQPDLDLQGALINYKLKGNKVEYAGQVDVNGIQAYALVVTFSNGNKETYYIDPTTYHVLRSLTKKMVDGKTDEQKADFSNYQTTPDGYIVPMNTQLAQGAIQFTVVKFNIAISKDLFRPSK